MPKTLSIVTAAACAAIFALSLAAPATADCTGHKDRTADASTTTVAQTPIPQPDKGS